MNKEFQDHCARRYDEFNARQRAREACLNDPACHAIYGAMAHLGNIAATYAVVKRGKVFLRHPKWVVRHMELLKEQLGEIEEKYVNYFMTLPPDGGAKRTQQ